MSLIHEKGYNGIVVKEILARANVGRSTFYAHFRDKDELLESSIRDTLRANQAASPPPSRDVADNVLRFSLPILEHIGRFREVSDGAEAEFHDAVHERLGQVLAELIADDLSRLGRTARAQGSAMPHDLLAQYVASTFLGVLSWWLLQRELLPAAKADQLFRSLVRPTLAAAFE